MVVFTCNHCGESLQKPRVEKHYNVVCRMQKFLTCVDCFKDFRGDEYNIHTKCVSEEKRYSGKDFVEKTKKGEVKQESWMEMIKSIIMHESNLKPQHKNLLETISSYNNVPRKRVKFINFIKSSTGGRTNIQDIEAVWDIIEKHKSQNVVTQDNQNGGDKSVIEDENQSNDVNEASTKKKKKKCDISVGENANNDNINSEDIASVNGISKKKKKKQDESVAENGKTNDEVDSGENSVVDGEISSEKKKRKLDVSSVENNTNNSENSGKKKKKSEKTDLNNLAKPRLETEVPCIENGAKQSKKKRKHKMEKEVVENSTEVVNEIAGKKEKPLNTEETDKVANGDQNSTNEISFSFENQINEILLKKQAIKKEKLYKKILNRYLKITGETISDDKIQKKIDKRLKKCDNICVEGNFVKIIS